MVAEFKKVVKMYLNNESLGHLPLLNEVESA
uniref:Uncharacterized protein n=1 Tax=Anguilla anguilla TaxID=7936 RepID=A0A0E9SBT0_ANGAN